MKISVVCSVLILSVVVKTNPALNTDGADNIVSSLNHNALEDGFRRKLNAKCSQRDNHACMMLKMILYMNRIFKKASISINENLEITRSRDPDILNEPEDHTLLGRALQSDEEALGVLVAEKIWQFIRTRTVRYKLHSNADIVLATEPRGNLNIGLSISPYSMMEEGRGKMKNMGPLMAIIVTKMGVVGALFIKGLLLLASKALIVSKIALLLTIIIGLKKLLAKKHVSYEVVSHPHHSHDSHHGHDTYSSGWARALDGFLDGLANVPEKVIEGRDLAYFGQKPI